MNLTTIPPIRAGVAMEDRLQTALTSTGAEAMVLTSPENVLYATGVDIMTQRSIPDRLAAVIVTSGVPSVFVVCKIEAPQAHAETVIPDIRDYVEFQVLPADLIASVLRDLGTTELIAIEGRHLTYDILEQFKVALPQARFTTCDTALDRSRIIKSPSEINEMARVAMMTDRAIHRTFTTATVGETEASLACRLQTAVLEEGAERVNFTVLAAGKNALMSHPISGPYKTAEGDLLRTDFGATSRGYCSDLARTVAVGRASQRQRDNYAYIWETHVHLIEMMRPGVRIADLINHNLARWDARGWEFTRPHIGHSIGLGLHENPMITVDADMVFEPGMVFCIEPAYSLPGIERIHIEDTIAVTETGPRILSQSADWGSLLVVDPI
ncbi:Xaa-Pro peptidase family protein [Pseudoruegeria sp. SK021]|uniref:M24 family metallopeptidase n=1 Tax=Pseudoruegeria sp. SK021 TaxID=1933035 RepID=UPI000A23B76C|nr:Xaa-Pro peptidase family protein [Pseudoruegeria sp. SK021]OSP53466.1 hypothetical protein BV911_17805 [Pseudoruegeria sp. SK021]